MFIKSAAKIKLVRAVLQLLRLIVAAGFGVENPIAHAGVLVGDV
jgi:hypothetical protein